MKPRLLLTHTPAAFASHYGVTALTELEAVADVVRNPTATPLDAAGLIAHAAGCHLIVCDRQVPAPADVFAALPALVSISRCAVDIRTIDVAAASAAGVLVTQASAGFMTPVAELGLGLMLDLSRNISNSVAAYRASRQPPAPMGRELKGAVVGIVGYGAIGVELSRLCCALGMQVLVCDPHKTVGEKGVTQVRFNDLLTRADYVVCLAVATAETENLFDASAFARMHPAAFFINLSRGNLVDEAALAAALDARRIAGAAMDVGRAADQMPSPHLAARTDIVATPHIGGQTPPATAHQAMETVAQVRMIITGKAPAGAVNGEHAHRLRRLPLPD